MMDEIDLDKLIADSENFRPESPAQTSGISEAQAPRLRKIKRPKHPGKPISGNTAPQNPSAAQTGYQQTSNPYGTQEGHQPASNPYSAQENYRTASNPYGAQENYQPTRDLQSQPQSGGYQAQPTSYQTQQHNQTPPNYPDPASYNNPQGYSQAQAHQNYQPSGYPQAQNYTPADPNRELMRANQQPVFDNNYDQEIPALEEQTEEYDSYSYQTNSFIAQLDLKKLIGISLLCLFVGLFIGKFLFSSEQVVNNGLQGVVVNPEVPKGRSRCGVAEKSQGCVLYIMNPQRQDLNGRDFYDLASQLTGRQRFVIETGNMRYSTVKIKPGNIAQLNIPPLQ